MRHDCNLKLFTGLLTILVLIFIYKPEHGFCLPENESEFPIRSTGPVKFDLDLCQFAGTGDSTRIEFYYSVYLTGPDTNKTAETNNKTIDIFLKILSHSGIVLDQFREDKTISFADSLQRKQNATYIDLKSTTLFPDSVLIQLIIQDKASGKTGEVIQPLTIRQFDNEFTLSGLYFISHVQRASGNSVFERSGIMMVPHPSRTFFISDNSQKAFIFYEINNLTYDASQQSFYDAYATVFDIKGNEVFKNSKELIKVGSTNSSRIEVLPIGNFDNGIYKILVQVIDRESGIRSEISSRFKILRGDSKDTNILPMSDEESQKYLDQIKYIATDQELKLYNQLNSKGKQEFLLQFWKSRDPDPSTPENEFMIEHFKRLAEVEGQFKGGINSDMGRVYIKYGPPLQIERMGLNVHITHAVEKWIYTINGRTEFVFVDRIGDGTYFLVHSTHLDEFSNPNWQQDL